VSESVELTCDSEATTAALAVDLAQAVLRCGPNAFTLYLEGPLGAGKTTFARSFIAGLGHVGRVPSPSYTLVEPYEVAGYHLLHVDLYRLRDPAELADLGLDAELRDRHLLVVEWPSQAADRLPPPDLRLGLEPRGQVRQLILRAGSVVGAKVLQALPELKSETTG
jgi:tRNA threonylcarbamoyladenosine biosynthesis protein TsaE